MSDLEQSIREAVVRFPVFELMPTFRDELVAEILAAVRSQPRAEPLSSLRMRASLDGECPICLGPAGEPLNSVTEEMQTARREVERLQAENSKFREALTEISARYPRSGQSHVPGLIARSALKDAE